MLLKKIRHMMLAITGVIVIFSTGVQAKDEKMTIGAIYLDTRDITPGCAGGYKTAQTKPAEKLAL